MKENSETDAAPAAAIESTTPVVEQVETAVPDEAPVETIELMEVDSATPATAPASEPIVIEAEEESLPAQPVQNAAENNQQVIVSDDSNDVEVEPSQVEHQQQTPEGNLHENSVSETHIIDDGDSSEPVVSEIENADESKTENDICSEY